MGNTESSSSPRTVSLSAGEDDAEEEEYQHLRKTKETSLLLTQSLSYDSTNSSSTPSPDKTSTKKKKRQSSETTPATNLHGEARDLAAMCFWVSAFLNQFNKNTITTPGSIAEDGYTPEETLQMLLFAAHHQQQQQQQEHHSSSNNNNNNSHAEQQQQQDPSSIISLVVQHSLQELHEQCKEYMNAHSQPSAPRIINSRSRLRRRQRLIERPMTLLLSSSSEQVEDEDLFYGIVKDDVHQRIVLVFHETPTMLKSSKNNRHCWQDLLHVHQVQVPLPSTLQGKIPRHPNNSNVATTEFVDSIGLRVDLYHFLFSNNNNPNSSSSRYQTLLTALQHVLRAHPSYTFHVTGFYGGAAACAIMVAFFLAAEPQAVLYNHVLFTTNPIVNCLAFACPRVGDAHFLQACQYLEQGATSSQQQQSLDDEVESCRNYSSPLLRMGRIVVNDVDNDDNDASAQIPMWNYSHVGFQIRLYHNVKDNNSNSSKAAPEITYPKLVDHWKNRWSRTCGNAISILAFWQLLQQHQSQDDSARRLASASANYRMAIQQAQGHLQEYKEGLPSLYSSSSRDNAASDNWTGF